MANQEHVDLLKQGVAEWNEWREQHQEIQPDLSGADLRNVDLSEVNLSNADLSDAVLNYTDLSYASLSYANLSGAKLFRAVLSGAQLNDADLKYVSLSHANLGRVGTILRHERSNDNLDGIDWFRVNLNCADLSYADLSYTDLRGANLKYANFHYATVRSVTFADLDLRLVKGLAEINHEGPSNVQLHTVQLPSDGSTLHFLRGAGVPDKWIDFWRSMMMHPIQYHSLFISYSSKDETLARRLHADLQDHGVRCWFAPHDMKIGDKIRARIDEAIHLQDKLLLLLSEHALASTWIEDEVEAALEKEQRHQREVLFPIRLDESVMQTTQAWAAKLRRTRHIGDFTNWTEPQAYQQAFERLLRDLKAENVTKGETDG